MTFTLNIVVLGLRLFVDTFARLILKVCTGSGLMQSRLNAR